MSSKLRGKAAVGSLTLLAVLTGSALIPSAAAEVNGGYFQIHAQGQAANGAKHDAYYGVLPSKDSGSNPGGGIGNPGGGEPTPQPPKETPEEIEARQKEEAAIAQWGAQVELPAPKITSTTWTVGAGNGRFVIHDGAQGGYSTDGSTWNVKPNQAQVVGAGEVAYNNGIFVVANDLPKPSGKTETNGYSRDNGVTWTSASSSTFGYSRMEATKSNFATILPSASTQLTTGKFGVTYRAGLFGTRKIGGVAYVDGAPSSTKNFYTPLDAIAANPAQDMILVAESGRDRDSNFVKDPKDSKIKTVTEAGLGSTGIHMGVGTIGSTLTWTENVLPGSWATIDWLDGQFIAISTDGATVAKSSDGMSWTQTATDLGTGFTKLIKSGDQYMAIKQKVTPQEGGKVFATSSDGVKWTRFNIDPSKAWKDIAGQNGCFVAVSLSGTSITTCK